MNIYYLKKFRKEAWETIKVIANEYHRDRFNVINFGNYYRVNDLTLETAKKVLRRERTSYIIRLCLREKRIKLNKQLEKL